VPDASEQHQDKPPPPQPSSTSETPQQPQEKSPSASKKKLVVEVSPSPPKDSSQPQGEPDLEQGLGTNTAGETHPDGGDEKSVEVRNPSLVRELTPAEVELQSAQKTPAGFIQKLLTPKFRYIRDLYPLMFFLDVICFFIVAFGYSSFGEGGSGDVLSDIKASRIPLTFALMLIVISLMIVIDRGLYLRKAVVSKLVYQMLSVVFLHVWIFFVLPSITSK